MKLYYEALKCLPNRFIHDDTKACLFSKSIVVAFNPKYTPMIYTPETKAWKKMTFKKEMCK